jgi:hypothetical protein
MLNPKLFMPLLFGGLTALVVEAGLASGGIDDIGVVIIVFIIGSGMARIRMEC